MALTVAIIIFVLTYILLLSLPKYRPLIAVGAAFAFVVSGILPVSKALGEIDLNVLLMIAGTMGLVSIFIESKMPNLLADLILEKTHRVRTAVVALALFAGIVSAFIDNVATVIMIAPVAIAIGKRLNISPVVMIIAIAVSSNLQGAATLVGDTTSILLGASIGMDFMDFFFMDGRPGMFWTVEVGAILSAIVLFWMLRKEKGTIQPGQRTVVTDYVPTILLCSMILLLIGASFIRDKPANTNGYICVTLFAIGALINVVRKKSIKAIVKPIKEIDYQTLILLAGLFVVVGGISEAGVVDAICGLFIKLVGDNVFFAYTVIVWMSVLCSAFIDNIPYTATMLPVVSGVSALLGIEPQLLAFGLLAGATLGGNLTPVGASANIAGIGLLRKEGYEVKNRDFMRISVPFTLVAVLSAYIFIWIVWS